VGSLENIIQSLRNLICCNCLRFLKIWLYYNNNLINVILKRYYKVYTSLHLPFLYQIGFSSDCNRPHFILLESQAKDYNLQIEYLIAFPIKTHLFHCPQRWMVEE